MGEGEGEGGKEGSRWWEMVRARGESAFGVIGRQAVPAPEHRVTLPPGAQVAFGELVGFARAGWDLGVLFDFEFVEYGVYRGRFGSVLAEHPSPERGEEGESG